MTCYAITWTWKGQRYLLDVNTASLAAIVGVVLAETKREDVTVSEVPYEDGPERRNRIWARVQQRLQEPPAVFA